MELLSGHESCEEQLRELGLFNLEEERAGGSLIALNCWNGGCSKLGRGLFSHIASERILDGKGLAFYSGYVIPAALCSVLAYILLE